MTKSRIFLYVLLAFILGVAIRSFVALPYAVLLFVFLAGSAAMVTGILRRRQITWVYGLLVLALMIGVLRFEEVAVSRPDLSFLYGRALAFQGTVWEEPRRSAASQQVKVKITAIYNGSVEPSFYVLVVTQRYPEYFIGEKLRLQGVLEEPVNFGEFDYASHLAKDEIFSTMAFPSIEKLGQGKQRRLHQILNRAKRSFEGKIGAVLPEPHGAFLNGLILGERESLPPDLVENFRLTGTSHIVALSGYNITLVGRFFMAALLLLTVPYYSSFWLATSAIILFVMLTGASPSVVRAGIMGILVLVAQREGRAYRMGNALAFAAAIMIFHNPRILRLDAAFQLSFLATLGLVYLAPRVEKRIDAARSRLGLGRPAVLSQEQLNEARALFPFKRILVETLAAQLAVLPLLLYLFGSVSWISPAANVAVLIAVPYSMAAGFITGVSGYFSSILSGIFGWSAWILLEYKLRIIELLAGVVK